MGLCETLGCEIVRRMKTLEIGVGLMLTAALGLKTRETLASLWQIGLQDTLISNLISTLGGLKLGKRTMEPCGSG